ncbi:alpha-amylase family glycosyl hydrolase [Streptomyces sp. NPDC014991]|uniref:alpha-amylase family glycosyl hydrolase n=1 Tax=Streptomyces sp. NPDC014991 TaxID=3364935 RepID=UPI0037015F93
MAGRPRHHATALAVALFTAVLPPLAPSAAAGGPPPPPSDTWLARQPARPAASREQFYLLLPDRFADGWTADDRGGLTGDRTVTGYDPTDKDFFQGGDLRGVIGHLDYIKGLGTTAIWLAPVFRNKPVTVRDGRATANYHGYAITDFTRVDPHFGTETDLSELIHKAHAKGMKVFFDVITNHTADTVDYAEKRYGYRSKGAYPYLDTEGRPFDDSTGRHRTDAAGAPYTPQVSTDPQDRKVPDWLNDPSMYHNRGNSTFAGESALYGDFMGMDDLWTERPEVVAGMEKIYEKWVGDFGVDGFRVDTAKNVDMDFWTRWATALGRYAAHHGRRHFFLFAEAFSADASITAPYVTQGRLDATLDFPFQAAARNFASRGGPADDLAHVFAQDYRYSTDKTNAYSQVTFLGSHDMGRIGSFLAQDNPGANDAELLRRDRLAHELMFLSRGNPVVYSGDEQGFTGAGGDVEARQTMFASKVADYLDDDEIGTDRTAASDAYDTSHPLYRAIAALSRLTKENPALRDGVQTERYAQDSVYAFSRTDVRRGRDYLVAFNNATEDRTVTLTTGPASTPYQALYGAAGRLRGDGGGKITVTVPALSSVVYEATRPPHPPTAQPSLGLHAPAAGAHGTVELSADVPGPGYQRVVFAAQVGNGPWHTLGTADHAPYRVTQNIAADVAAGTPLRYKAVVVDSTGRTADALAATTAGRTPTAPGPTAARHWAVVHYRRPDGDYAGLRLRTADGRTADFTGRDAYGAFAWLAPSKGATEIPFTVEKDGVTDGPERTLDFTATPEVWTEQGGDAVTGTRPGDAYPAQDPRKAIIHYHRPDGDYDGWGLHAWTGAADPPEWNDPIRPAGRDSFGLLFEVPLSGHTDSLSYILHKKEEKDVPSDEALDFSLYGHEVWRVAGDPAYLTPTLGGAFGLDLGVSAATWLDDTTVVWRGTGAGVASQQLVYAPDGGISVKDGALSDEGHWLRLVPAHLTDAQRAASPRFSDDQAFTVDPRDRDRVADARASRQVIATQRGEDGALLGATTVRLPPDRPPKRTERKERAAL